MSSSFIHVVACDRIASLYKVEWYSIQCVYHIFLIQSYIVGCLGYFHLLAIVNSFAGNVDVQISLWEISRFLLYWSQISLRSCFQFFWVNMQKQDCWITWQTLIFKDNLVTVCKTILHGASIGDRVTYWSQARYQFSSVAQSCPTLRSRGLQPARSSCPSSTPGVYPNSCPLSQWCHPTISSSVVPFSSCLKSFPADGISTSISVLPMNTQDWSPLGWTGWISLLNKGLSSVFSNTTIQKHQFFGTQLSL